MHGRHVYKGIAGSVLHTFVLLSGMRAGLFRLCYARSMPLLFAPRSASRSWVCRVHCRASLRVCGYAARIVAVRFASVGMPLALPVRFASVGMLLVLPACFASVGMLLALSRSASRLWACRSHCRGPLRVCGHAACIAGPLRVHEYAACIAGSLRVRRDRGDAVSLTLRLCLPRVLPVSTLRDV